ncbi:SEL1-like repeat protein [Hansschlegelia quercus]|nr:SEL1-like repeat protein [Hansschlegelia quercus]
MSASDPKIRQIERYEEAIDESAPLSGRLASRPSARSGSAAPELDRLVGMLTNRGGAEERLSKALEGLSRWTATPEPAREHRPERVVERQLAPVRSIRTERSPEPLPKPAGRATDPVSPDLEERLAAFARTLTERPRLETPRLSVPVLVPGQTAASASVSTLRPARAAAQEPAAKAPPIASLRAALAEIANRQKALDSEYESDPSDSAPALEVELGREVEALRRRTISPEALAEMRSEIGRLGQTVGSLPTRVEIDGLIREIGALSARLVETRPAALDPEALRAIDMLVGQVERMRGEAATPSMISGLAEELGAISARLDVLTPRSAAAIDALAERIDGIKAELDAFPRMEAVGDLATQIKALVARLDEQEKAAAPTRKAVEGLTTRVAALDHKIDVMAMTRGDERHADLEGLPSKSAMADLGRQIEALTDGLKARGQPVAAPSVINALSTRVASMDDKLATLAEQLQLSASPRTIELFADKVDGLNDRVDMLSISSRSTSSSLERVEDAVRIIAEQMRAAPATPFVDTGAIEAQVSRLVDGLDRNDGRLEDLNAAFYGLASRIEQSCEALGASAAGVSGTDAGGEIARALEELRAASSLAERRSAEALESVRGTLERLVDRVERGPISAGLAEHMTAAREATIAPNLDATEAARAAARRALAEAGVDRAEDAEPEAASFRPITGFGPDHPIEPGAAGSRPELVAAQTAASFIAAARRAAMQTTSEEDTAAPAVAIASDPKSSRYSGMFASLKARKRPMLVAIAASLVVLAGLYVARDAAFVEEAELQPPSLDEPITSMAEAPAASDDVTAALSDLPPAPEHPAAPGLENHSAVDARRVETTTIAGLKDEGTPPEVAQAELPTPAPSQEAPKSEAAKTEAAKVELQARAETPAPTEAAPLPRAKAADLTDFAFAGSTDPKGKPDWQKAEPATTGSIAPTRGGLPDAIGGATLRLRAVSGDPAAQLEVADRLLSGHNNVAPDPVAGAIWLEKAASQGLAPAQHRLGSLYEKGSGVTRDLSKARIWYERAAAAGNVRAMHNLGVIHAEGGLGRPDFDAAAVWFRLAAERGLVDSEYNLGVLNARGLGGKRNLMDAYKWFALAADQGDEDAGRKRDEVAKALGKSLDSAKATVAAFVPRPLDAAANDIPSPPGGWDVAATSASATAAP